MPLLAAFLLGLATPLAAFALEEPFLRWGYVDARFRTDLRQRPVEREWESPETSEIQLAVIAADPWGDRTIDYPSHFLPEEDGLATDGPGVTALDARTKLPLAPGFGFTGGFQGSTVSSTVDQAELNEAELFWHGERHRIGLGRSKLRWGAGTSGSLLAGRSAPPRWQLRWRTDRVLEVPTFGWSALRGRTWSGSAFLAYLNDESRQISDPLLLGHRLSVQPWSWFEFSLTRTILFGGDGRTSRLTLPRIVDILLARNENLGVDGSPTDSDQRASYELRLRVPREWLPALLDGVDLYWEYAGEDMVDFPIPSAVAHQMGGLVRVRDWTLGLDFVETETGANRWYDHFVAYGPMAYTYSGFPLGHSIGGDARLYEVTLWSPPGDLRGRVQLRSERYGFFQAASTRDFRGVELAGQVRANRRLTVELSALRSWRTAEGSTERAPDREKLRVDFRMVWVP